MRSPDLDDAIAFTLAHEIAWPRDPMAAPGPGQPAWGVHHDDPAPYNRLRGPVQSRHGVSGVVRQRGRVVAAWGAPARPELTFSVAKTYLALLAGIAQQDGLLPDVEAPVHARLPGIGFDSAHNRGITWLQLLTQTSEWEGECFGLPDTVDRWRHVAQDPRPATGPKGGARPLQAPGRYWEYNDVRINQLALALLHLFRAPLPAVFLERVLRPLGGGEGFAWRGYDDAWVDLPGVGRVQSVPGGTHWGGGASISSQDQALVGQLLLDGGRPLLPEGWVGRMTTPTGIAPFYGWLMWLNRERSTFPAASAESSFMLGAGGHMTWIEPAHEAVVVLRWVDPAHQAEAVRRFAAALAGA